MDNHGEEEDEKMSDKLTTEAVAEFRSINAMKPMKPVMLEDGKEYYQMLIHPLAYYCLKPNTKTDWYHRSYKDKSDKLWKKHSNRLDRQYKLHCKRNKDD